MIEAKEIRDLINLLNENTRLYDKGVPIMSDKEWDDLYFKLKKLEEKTGIIYPDSPTASINYKVISKLEKKEHEYKPMLSLDKTKNSDDVQSFVKGHDWCAMFKMDGLSCRLTYTNGLLVGAETRGNGEVGEWILHNAKVIPSIPRNIPTWDIGDHKYDIDESVIIDGEIICTFQDFEEFKDIYKNPRNFAAGSIRLLDAKETASRKLTFVAWDLVKGIDEDFFFWRLEKLDDWGFKTVPRVGDAETVEDAIDILDRDPAHSIYPIDGYVFKFESVKYGDSLGRTDHHWNNAIAYKFYDEEYETTLKYIDYDVSRLGVLTPVAVFEPIDIDGSVCERASLHNMSIMEDILGHTPYYGQHIWIYKANQIIPQVKRAVKMDYGDIIAAGGVTVGLGGDHGVLCPICGGLTEIIISDSGVKNLYCTNEQCEGKLAQRIDHYCGKKGLDIKGLSRKTIEKLIGWGWINELNDLYKLNKYKSEWISKPGFGEASVYKILDAIEESRTEVDLASFIAALGIPLVGRTIAKEIVKYYCTWYYFMDAIGSDWTEFEGFGPEISKAINSFDYTEAEEIVAAWLIFKQPEVQSETTPAAAIKDKVFVITGKMINYKNRDLLKNEIESLGGKVASSISSKTDYLINNDINSTSSKNKKAKELGIPIITEEKYLLMKP